MAYEMTPMQRMIFDGHMKYSKTSIGNVGGYIVLSNQYSKSDIISSIQLLQKKNYALRMRVNENGTVEYSYDANINFEIVDADEWNEDRVKKEIENRVNAPLFEYAKPLVKYVLIQNKQSYYLVLVASHMVIDKIGAANLSKQFLEILKQISDGVKVDYAIEEYSDNASDERKYYKKNVKSDKEVAREYFFGEDDSFADEIAMPLRRESKSVKASIFEEIIDKKLIRNYIEEYGFSMEVLMQAALMIYYKSITASDKVCIGRVVANRKISNYREVGMFANTLPLFVDFSKVHSFFSLCEMLKSKNMSMHRFSGVSIGEMLTKGQSPIDLFDTYISYFSRSKLFDENKSFVHQVETDSLDVSLAIHMEDGEKVKISYKYRDDCYTIQDIVALNQALTEIIVKGIETNILHENVETNLDKKIEKIQADRAFYNEESIKNIIDEFNKTSGIALVDLSKSPKLVVSYDEFRRCSIFVSECLKRVVGMYSFSKPVFLNPTHQPIIALQLKRSYKLPIAMLSVLAMGGVIYPVSIDESEKNLAKIKKNVDFLLTDRILNSWLVHYKADDFVNLKLSNAVGETAYIINTSGSTGKPKLAMNSYRALSVRLSFMLEKYKLYNKTFIQKTKNTFDVSIWEIFLPLMSGGRMVILPDGDERNPEKLYQAIIDENISQIHFVPSMLASFLSWVEHKKLGANLRMLKNIFSSGEALHPSLVNRFMEQVPGVKIHNLYGPAECAIDVSAHTCFYEEGYIPIGSGIWGTKLSIVNSSNKEVPAGYIGEIKISGELVGEGYLNNQEETDKAFVDDGYLTGDLGYVDNFGEVVYVGRRNREVKLRGMRVNLTTLEKEVLSIPLVTAAAAIVMGNRLILFVATILEKGDLYNSICELVPIHYNPDRLIIVDEIPYTANGKCDYVALESILRPFKQRRTSKGNRMDAEYVKLAHLVRDILEDLLGVRIASPLDSIFDYGMDSLTITSFIIALEKKGYTLNYDEVYKYKTIKNITDALRKIDTSTSEEKRIVKVYPEWTSFFAGDSNNMHKNVNYQRLLFTNKVVVAVPYAGNSLHVFDRIAASFEKQGVGFLGCDIDKQLIEKKSSDEGKMRRKNVDELANQIVEELGDSLMGKDVVILGCCVGSALALEIARRITNIKSIKLLFIGSLPTYFLNKETRAITWDAMPKKVGEMFLSNLYGKKTKLTENLYNRLKSEARLYITHFEKVMDSNRAKVDANVDLIFGKEDKLTTNYSTRYIEWSDYISGGVKVVALEKARHFLSVSHGDYIVSYINEMFTR